MGVRRALESEQEAMARVCAEAFWDDEIFGNVVHPFRNQYPDDVHLYWLERFRECWALPSDHFFVSTVTDAQTGEEVIAAVIQWRRKGQALRLPDPAPSNLPPNRAADPRTAKILDEAYDCVKGQWSGTRAEVWDILWLATRPRYQGQGHGKALAQWGIEQAKEEGVALSVISAYGKDGFYNKLGYTTRGGRFDDGPNNPLKGRIQGGQFWWFEDFVKKEDGGSS